VVSISQADITSIVGQGLYIVLIVSAPMLITALIVGFIVSIFQAATQINEQTLSFVPKDDKKRHVRAGGLPGPEGKYERDYTFNGCGRTVTVLPTKK